MRYIYTKEDCPKCETLKKNYKNQGIEFVERDAARLTTPADDKDQIDLEAHIQLNMNNMTLPVEVQVDE
jgi:glutaredoxin